MSINNSENNSQQLDLQYYLGTVVRRKLFLIIPVGLAFIAAVAFSFIMQKEYEAYSTILVSSRRMIDPLVSQFAVTPEIREILDTLSKQVLTWPRLQQLVVQLKLAENIKGNPIELKNFILSLKERINVSMIGDDLIQIKYFDKDPLTAQKVVNTLTQNFIDENARIKKEEAQNAIDFIGDQLRIYRQKLESSQKNFSTSKIDSDLRLAQNRKKLFENRLSNLQKLIPSRVTSEQTPLMTQLNERQGNFEAELARLMIDAKKNNPRVAELRKIIKEIKKKIKDEKEKVTVTESISVTNPIYLQADQELKKVEMEIDYLEKRRKNLVESDGEFAKIATEGELANLERDKRVEEDIYQVLLQQLEAAYVSERLQNSEQGSRFTVIEYARLPLEPVRPNKIKVILMGLFAGCALGVGLILMAEYFDRSFLVVDEAKSFLPMPFLGTVSRMVLGKAKAGPLSQYVGKLIKKNKILSMLEFVSAFHLKEQPESSIASEVVFHHEPQSKVAEEYRVIRTHILSMETESPSRVFMFTSSVMGEGKTVTSANMAVAMAHSERNTLLVDCDLRKGYVHDVFGKEQSPGLVDIVGRDLDIDSVLVDSGIRNLTILPRGSSLKNPAELLGSAKVDKVFEELKKRFEIIIMDTPPVLNLPDSCVLGKIADKVMMIVRMERTQRDDVIGAHMVLKRSHIELGGFILTNLRYYMPKSLYGYYYGEAM